MTLQPLEGYLRQLIRVDSRAAGGLRAEVGFPADLQGPPETGHGGGVTALLVEMVRLLGGEAACLQPIRIEVTLHHPAPLDTPLTAEVAEGEGGWRARLLRSGVCLAEVAVRPAPPPPAIPAALREEWGAARGHGQEVPGYDLCLGCGSANPRGAQVRFEYDERLVWKRVQPQAHFRSADGTLYPGYLYVVCDELGWWLGALQQGECGVSNRIQISLGAPLPHGTPLLLVGRRSEVTTTDPRRRIWQTRTLVVTPEWEAVASAEVQFVGSRAFSRIMLPRFLPINDPLAVRRAFPRMGETGTAGAGPS